eukprot:g14073.t1
MSKITPDTESQEKVKSEETIEANVPETQSEDKKTTMVALTDAEEKIYDKVMAKIQEKYDLVEKKSEFDEFYETYMKDQELGAYDIIFCPFEYGNCRRSIAGIRRYAYFVKFVEVVCFVYVWLCVLQNHSLLGIDEDHQHVTKFMNSSYTSIETIESILVTPIWVEIIQGCFFTVFSILSYAYRLLECKKTDKIAILGDLWDTVYKEGWELLLVFLNDEMSK